jgi:hypothetical protein
MYIVTKMPMIRLRQNLFRMTLESL